MSDALEVFDDVFDQALHEVQVLSIETDEATAAIKNLKVLSECRPPKPEPESEGTPEPTTFWGKLKTGLAKVWDNETTRVTIKAGGALTGVALVTLTTIHRDHVITKEALSQANQRNN